MTTPRDAGPPLRPGRRLLFTLVYLALLGAFLVIGVEVISRYVFEPETVDVYVTNEIAYDGKVGWRGTRNFSAAVPHGRYPVPIQVDINADGFRDESWDTKLGRARARGSKKILILGDSLLYGWTNPVDGRLSEQLLVRYQRDGRDVEIFNAGIPAYGPHNQLRLLPELLERVQPHEVVLLFCNNDYGDAALPYDYRYPFRVYQPFHDSEGRLIFNADVPRRPSLVMRDTLLGRLRLWYAIDQLRYAIEDRRYARYGIPNARSAPIHLFHNLLGTPDLRARFPYVEPIFLAAYAGMAELSRAAGARFTFLSTLQTVPPSGEPFDAMFRAKLEARGVRYLSCPADEGRHGRWRPTLLDGHPNFIWAWIMANALYSDLEGKPYRLDFAEMPQMRDVPTQIDLANIPASARFLEWEWGEAQGAGRALVGIGSFLLRNREPGPARLEIVASAPRPTRLVTLTVGERELCRFLLGPAPSTQSCAIDTTDVGPILFVDFVPEGLDPAAPPIVQVLRLGPAVP